MVRMYIYTYTYIRMCLSNLIFYRPKIDAYEITALADLSSFFLNKSTPYKYVVYSTFPNSPWEYIHDLPAHGIFNRCLELSQSSGTGKFIILKTVSFIFLYYRKIIPCIRWLCVP